jgi:O-antigen/teichoic acid export membrane protein
VVAELIVPAGQALLPGLSKLQDERSRFLNACERAIAVSATVALGLGTLVSVLAHEIIVFVLGSKWTYAGNFATWMAVAMAFLALAELHRSITAAISKPYWSTYLYLFKALAFSVVCGITGYFSGAEEVAMAFAATAAVTTLLDYSIILRRLGVPYTGLRGFFRPFVSATLAWSLIMALPFGSGFSLFVAALIKTALVAAIYLVTLGSLWAAAGRPFGPESMAIRKCEVALGKMRTQWMRERE